MTILLPTLAVAFGAFCVWLTVRIVNRRERWAKWTLAVVLALPALYFTVYLITVSPVRVSSDIRRHRHLPEERAAIYSIGECQQFWGAFFGPANSLDRQLRRDAWRNY